ncbi:MAG: DUF11 domain-containing protein [Methanomicrobia archaeon]|nr:DUF11 domain-containing protein [Methanomicrobia archaeon]
MNMIRVHGKKRGEEGGIHSHKKKAEAIVMGGAVLALLVVFFGMALQPAAAQTWPTEWILIGGDRNENGPQDNFRDVEYAYYNFDDEYLYLRMCTYGTAAFKSGGLDGRFKWFIDLDNNMYKTGGIGGGHVVEGEYLLFVEDANPEDGIGEVYLLYDIDGDGSFDDDWGQPVGGTYVTQNITNLSIAGYRISGKCVDLYVRFVNINISAPSRISLIWVTDQENPNLDQAPTTDFPDSGLRLGPFCVQCRPNLIITKYDFPDPVKAGENLTYTIIYENTGNLNATNVTITETYDANVTFVTTDPSPDPGTNDTWTIANLPVGVIQYINITVRVNDTVPNGTILTNYVNITSEEGVANNHTVDTVVVGEPVLEIAKSAFPDPVEPGETLTYTIFFENLGDVTAVNTNLTDILPQRVTYISASLEPNQTFDDNHTLVWNIGDLPPNELRTITITVSVNSPLPCGCPLVNFVNLTADGLDEVNHTEETTVVSAPVLDISKFDDPEPVEAGGVLIYTIYINNTGTANATNVTVTEIYDANVVFFAATPLPDSGNNIWNFSTINASETKTITITVNVTAPLPNGTLVLNYANVTSDQNVTNQIVISTTVKSAPVLLVEKADWPDPVAAGTNLTYVITYENTGNMNATNVTITEVYDINVTFINATPAPYLDNDTWFFANLPPDGKHYIYITVGVNESVTNGTLLLNYVNITSEEGVEGNDTEVTEIGEHELVLCKQDYPDPVEAGNNLTYTVCYANFGTLNATNTTITDVLPQGVTFVSASFEPNETADDNHTLVWHVGDLPPNERHNITINVSVNIPHPGGIVSNYVNITADGKPEGNDTEETRVISEPVLEFVKRDSPDPVRTGNLLTYTIYVNNTGTANATNVTVTDLFCDPNLSFVTATPMPDDAANTTWTNVSIAPGESWQITITVAVNGSLANGDIVYNCVNMTSDQTVIPELWQDTRVVAPEIFDPKIAVDQNGPPLEPGDAICYTAWINNTGDADSTDNPGNEFVDLIPENTVYKPGSLQINDVNESDDISDGVGYDAANTTIIWNGNITAGGTIKIRFCVIVDPDVPVGTTVISNQGTVYYDSNGDGTNDAQKPTDDPVTAPSPDPTELQLSISAPVPIMTPIGMVALVGLLSAVAVLRLRVRKRR